MVVSIEMMLIAIPIILNVIFLFLGMRYAEKRAISIVSSIIATEKATLKPTIEAYINSEQFQKALYSVGGIFGAGAISGTGMGVGKGKMKFQDLLIQLGSKFIDGLPSRKGLNLLTQQDLNKKQDLTLTIPEAK